MIIVVAWTVTEQRVVDPHLTRVDLGELHTFRDVQSPRACVWLLTGDESDRDRAQAFIDSDYPETGKVYTFPADEADPLGKARKQIVS